ncbi:MAG: bifunctional (p)ppGpp synthetase/guanosine-3',5'-bis(diphosphate) 3'-pyrophosphohydrolase [Candidatus Adiutrix sp.]|jgi:GTP pyrophosphokinase|nr:bifunctional (p)ppGpp synthetase/guanosine-3',5'-bis(diphosphate) 3'-pyrophosphohydrolase [Candidatus Adiutrix sp.]
MAGEYIPLEDAPVYGGQLVRIEEIIESLTKNHPGADVTLVQRAYIYAAGAHQGMTRRSGEPYLNHPLAVAGILCDMKLDVASVAAGLLHDTIEDNPEVTYEDVAKKFGKEVADIVDGVTKIGKMNFSSATERKAENLRKMIMAMMTDLRVILVKLADRLNNMRTLGFMPEHKQSAIATETLDIFAPLASRLGIHKIQTELEDLSLFYLEPAAYSEIRLNLSAGRSDRQQYVTEVIEYLTRRVQEFKIKARIEGRPKHIYSIWHKMRDQNLSFDQLYDLTAFRIIVDSIQDCYSALGVIHSVFKAIPGRFKDYINMPKANGYQSLHTAVIGPRNTRMEVQIRTVDMHNYAENGVAAHWRYKNGGAVSSEETQRITALRSILNWQENLDNPDAFLTSVKDSLAEHESIYVFTPAGDIKDLPAGACPVDFAYSIHTMVGHNCVGAKVNGVIVPLRQKLQNGDIVEVMTSRNGTPSRDWLNYAASPRAKARIRQWFAAEERVKAVDFGHEMLEKEMRKAGLPKAKLANQELLKNLGYANLDELNAAVAFGKQSIRQIMQILAPEKFKPETPAEPRHPAGHDAGAAPDYARHILVSGQSDIFTKLAKCCSPIPGEPIIGYITQGHGVSIHSATCVSLAGLDSDRLISASWSDQQEQLFDVHLQVRTENGPGLLLSVLNIISPLAENILEAHAAEDAGGDGVMSFVLAVKNQSQFNSVLKALKEIPAVKRAERIFPEKA